MSAARRHNSFVEGFGSQWNGHCIRFQVAVVLCSACDICSKKMTRAGGRRPPPAPPATRLGKHRAIRTTLKRPSHQHLTHVTTRLLCHRLGAGVRPSSINHPRTTRIKPCVTFTRRCVSLIFTCYKIQAFLPGLSLDSSNE